MKKIVALVLLISIYITSTHQEFHRSSFQVLESSPIIDGEETVLNVKQSRRWTFMVYLDGDNDLESYAIDDFIEMSSIGTTQEVAIVALFDRCSGYDTSYGDWTDTKLFNITKDMWPNESNALESWGERNMGDPQTLVDFVTYCINNFAAEHYALILWDHGRGYYGACWDEDNGGDNLDLSEIRWALKEIYSITGIKIDVLGFDACLMGNIEVAYSLKDYVDYVVFSQEYEPGDGWPYDSILDSLTNNFTMTPSELASIIVDEYINYYSNPLHSDENATLSAINVSHVAKYTYAAINRVAGYLLRYYNTYESDIIYAMNNAEAFYYDWQKDLKHFLIILRSRVSSLELISLLDEAIREIENAVINYGHLSLHLNAYGLSAYIDDSYYCLPYFSLDSSLHHQWDEFLKKILGYSPDVWFYDIKFYGLDYEGDGLYDADLIVSVDLDWVSSVEVYVKIYGTNGTSEKIVGESEVFTIINASSNDTINVTILPGGLFNTFRLEVYDTENNLLNRFYYYCDSNISNVPLDIRAPSLKILSPGNNVFTNTSTVVIEWEVNDTNLDHLELYVDNRLINDSIPNYETSYSIDISDGKHIIELVACDQVGNKNNTRILITVDTKEPSLLILSPDNNTYIGSSTVVIEWEAYDENLDHFELYVNDTLIDGNIPPNQTTYTVNLQDGVYVISLVVYDVLGNKNCTSILIFVDTQPPILNISSPANGTIINGTSVCIVWDITDNFDVGAIYVYVNGSLYQILSGEEKNVTINFDKGGSYNITIVAEDKAGNKDKAYLFVHVVISETTTGTETDTTTTESAETATNVGISVIFPPIDLQAIISLLVIVMLVIISLAILMSRRKSEDYQSLQSVY